MKKAVRHTDPDPRMLPRGSYFAEHDDGAYTVFVPSVPTPAAGAVYIHPKERVHLVDIPFNKAVSVISKWGSGARDLRTAMIGKSMP